MRVQPDSEPRLLLRGEWEEGGEGGGGRRRKEERRRRKEKEKTKKGGAELHEFGLSPFLHPPTPPRTRLSGPLHL